MVDDNANDAGKAAADAAAKAAADKSVAEKAAADKAAADKAAADKGGDKGGDKGKADDWRMIPDDFQDRDEIAKDISTFNSVAELARSFHLAKKQVSKAIVPLGKNPTNEELARYRKQLHIPEDAKGYHEAVKFDPPAGVDLENDAAKGLLDKFYGWAHANHISPAQAKGLVVPFLTAAAEDAKARADRAKELADAADTKLRAEMRTGYDAFNRTGELFVAAVAKDVPEFAYLLDNVMADGMKLGDHPIMRRVAGILGRRMGEQQLATLTMSDKDVSEGKKSMETLTASYQAAIAKGDTKEANRIAAERRALSQRLYGQSAR